MRIRIYIFVNADPAWYHIGMEKLSSSKCFGGSVSIYRHNSAETKCPMTFSIFVPLFEYGKTIPVLFWLSDLGGSHEDFAIKAGAFKMAAELGMAIICPDTSPRGEGVPDDPADDLGQGASFYIDATLEPWSKNYRMASYISKELPALLKEHFPMIDSRRAGISGIGMGGHGALTLFFRHREVFHSVSAFAPVVAPIYVPWGKKAFAAYLGAQTAQWAKHDSCALALVSKNLPPILIDVGAEDEFLDTQLKPGAFEGVCKKANLDLKMRKPLGYDHSYFFVQSFIDDHLKHHKDQLTALMV